MRGPLRLQQDGSCAVEEHLHGVGADYWMHAKRRRLSETEKRPLSVCFRCCLCLRACVHVCTGMGGKSAISKYMKLANPGMFH